MLEIIIETLVILGGVGFLAGAWKSVIRRGDQPTIRYLIGEGFLLPFVGQKDQRNH